MKRIATLGRSHTEECVSEYILQYSDDGELWRSVADTNAETQVVVDLQNHAKKRFLLTRFSPRIFFCFLGMVHDKYLQEIQQVQLTALWQINFFAIYLFLSVF